MMFRKYVTLIHEKLLEGLIRDGSSRLSVLIYTLSMMFWLLWNLSKPHNHVFYEAISVSIPLFVLLQSSLILISLHLIWQPKNRNIVSFIGYR
jgi:hypothetical protein